MKISWRIAGLRYRLKRLTARRLGYALRLPWYRSRLYGLTLGGGRRRELRFLPSDIWPGDAGRGQDIIAGNFVFGGHAASGPKIPWNPDGASADWQAQLHGFGWLRDLRAAGGDIARARARELVLDWIETQMEWCGLAWRPDVLGARVANWLGQQEFICAGAPPGFRERFLDSLSRQVRHLGRVVAYASTSERRIVALKGLIYAGLSFAENPRRQGRWIRMLEGEIQRQVLGDGGNIERSPVVQLDMLRHLIDIRAALRDAQAEVTAELQTAIDRMAPMLRFFRHGDGGLALFNDSAEDEGWLIDVVLTRAEARGKPLESALHSGFERITANRTLIIMDCGAPPPPGQDDHAHAGTLSFEFSVGKERLVTNCGAYADGGGAWHSAQRTTAAHSTVTVEDINSSQLLSDGLLGNRPENVTVSRQAADGSVWIDANHDGYTRSLGLVHHRRLYLSANGNDLRGEDTLAGEGNHRFAARFHLHPLIKASLLQDGSTVLLRLASGAGWRLKASGGVTSLQESVYLGTSSEIKRADQIVISGATQNGHGTIKWAFSGLSGKP